ncbi:unnamed protein product [Penicillium salamii]|uniref:Methyltransferase n=1 Tax=Penicillium salamii TaxID=1612424 RepID=A0A9W4NY18_9EURO|nr:unnamed protein product [Penicillium salamii]
MEQTINNLRGDVQAKLTFLDPPSDGSRSFVYVEEPHGGHPKRNFTEVRHQVTLSDIRGRESHYTLDKDGFQALRGVSSATTNRTFDSESEIRDIYFGEVEKLLLHAVPDASRVVIFDYTIRKHNPASNRQPVDFVHVDQSPKAAEQRLLKSISNPEEAQALLQGRYRIVNVWRPLNGKVETMPLAFASAASVSPGDLTEIERRYPDFTGATMGLKHKESHKWLYWSEVDNDERILLKCFDSKDGVAQRIPHAAFRDPRSSANGKPRESIEVRTLVF